MSLDTNTHTPDLPPAYDSLSPTNEIWSPTILILSGTTIHAESTDSPPLYQLSRAVALITAATDEVQFSRIEHTVKAASSSPSPEPFPEPVVKPRTRHIYTIKYLSKIPGGLGTRVDGIEWPNLLIQSVSRRTLGNLGVRRSRLRLPNKALKVLPIDVSPKKTSTNYGLPCFDKDAKPVFQIQTKDDGADVWSDGEGKAVAVEDRSEAPGRHKLVISASLQRETVDALVALWCGRVWQCSAENAKPVEEGMDGVRRKFRLAKEIRPYSMAMSGGFGGSG